MPSDLSSIGIAQHKYCYFSEDDEVDLDQTPTEVVVKGIRQGLHEALSGQAIPLSKMWEGIDAE
jgi:hypothetical protein